MSAPCLAALDIGTTSVKACLFTPELALVSRGVCEYALDTAEERVEAEAKTYLDAVQSAMRQALAAADGWRPAALGVTTQGETFVPVDQDGKPLRPFMVWLDGRAQAEAEAYASQTTQEAFYETTGLPDISGALPLCKLYWLKRHEPEVFDRARRFLLLEDYLLLWLTGRCVSERSLQTSTGWYDIVRDQPCMPSDIGADRLPELVECGETVGGLRPEAAALLGLEAGIPVSAGAMDQTAAALAAGVDGSGVVCETTGTALVMAACADRPTFSRGHRVTVYRHALPGKYLYLPLSNTGGMALTWFRDTFCPDVNGYEALDAMAAEVPCGCEGLAFLPFLSGSVDPDFRPQARAAFFGARLSTTRAHFARSVMESVAFLLRDFLGLLEPLGVTVREIRSLGGGARSALWQQIKADVCGRTFRVPACPEAAAMGAALLAGWGTGLVEPGVCALAGPMAAYHPNPAHATAYDQAYTLYRRLYEAVSPLYD